MRHILPLIATILLAPISLSVVAPAAHAQDARADWLDIEIGKSIVIETPRSPTAIAVTDPEIANFQPMSPTNRIQVQGKAIGSTDLVVQFGPGVPPMIYEVTVHRDLGDLVRRIDAIVEGEPPRVYPLGERVVVDGSVQDLDTLEQVAMVASIFDEDFINLMTVRGDHLVQLEVVFAEVSRTGNRSLGMNVLWGDERLALGLQGPGNNPSYAFNAPQLNNVVGAGNPVSPPGVGTFGIGAFIRPIDLTAMMSILSGYNLGKIHAQPTLVSLSGQQAEFLAGGEIPVPAPGGPGMIMVRFKEYGVKLSFVPTVLANNVIDIRTYLEISEPDFANATRVTGVEIPAFIARKARSHVRIESGMTFAIAGMLTDNVSYARLEVPGLGRIPIIGTLFRQVTHTREETEVVVYVTPRLVRPLGPGEVPAAPGTTENNNPSDLELFLLGMNHRPGSRTAQPTGAVGLQR